MTTEKPEPKHLATFKFKGLTYRYNKTYGEWRLVDKKPPVNVPLTIHVMANCCVADRGQGKTPIEALEVWLRSLTDLRAREAKEAEEHAKDLRAVVRHLKSRSWV